MLKATYNKNGNPPPTFPVPESKEDRTLKGGSREGRTEEPLHGARPGPEPHLPRPPHLCAPWVEEPGASSQAEKQGLQALLPPLSTGVGSSTGKSRLCLRHPPCSEPLWAGARHCSACLAGKKGVLCTTHPRGWPESMPAVGGLTLPPSISPQAPPPGEKALLRA